MAVCVGHAAGVTEVRNSPDADGSRPGDGSCDIQRLVFPQRQKAAAVKLVNGDIRLQLGDIQLRVGRWNRNRPSAGLKVAAVLHRHMPRIHGQAGDVNQIHILPVAVVLEGHVHTRGAAAQDIFGPTVDGHRAGDFADIRVRFDRLGPPFVRRHWNAYLLSATGIDIAQSPRVPGSALNVDDSFSQEGVRGDCGALVSRAEIARVNMAWIAYVQTQLSRSLDVDNASAAWGRVWESLVIAVNQLAAEQVIR